MPVTVKVNGVANSLIHKGSNAISTATIPDVCQTPSPVGPVPLPYPNISQSATLAKGTTTVKADGMMVAVKGSEFSLSNGDEPGVAGGIKSGTFIKESTWIIYSFDVKIEGVGACRLSDKKFQNHENTADLSGVVSPTVVLSTAAYQSKRSNLNDFMRTDTKPQSSVGDGSTAAAVQQEIATRQPVRGRWHYKKARDLSNGYANRDADAAREEKAGDITKDEAANLRTDCESGFYRNLEAAYTAERVPHPPWPT